jgi:UPF0176 protein
MAADVSEYNEHGARGNGHASQAWHPGQLQMKNEHGFENSDLSSGAKAFGLDASLRWHDKEVSVHGKEVNVHGKEASLQDKDREAENGCDGQGDVVVLALYHFTALTNCAELKTALAELCTSHGIFGTLLLAPEGINGTVAGSREAMNALLAFLRAHPELAPAAIESKEASTERMPFKHLKIKVKKEIVTFGVDGIDPTQCVGTYVEPKAWNALISDPDVVVIDTRNAFEYEHGTFAGAINPDTRSFREFPSFVKENLGGKKASKVAMFCTGGIRCEKASAFLLHEGFAEVYHLKGGILKYLEEIPEQQSLWRGSCFVFDERVAVNHGHYQSKNRLAPIEELSA